MSRKSSKRENLFRSVYRRLNQYPGLFVCLECELSLLAKRGIVKEPTSSVFFDGANIVISKHDVNELSDDLKASVDFTLKFIDGKTPAKKRVKPNGQIITGDIEEYHFGCNMRSEIEECVVKLVSSMSARSVRRILKSKDLVFFYFLTAFGAINYRDEYYPDMMDPIFVPDDVVDGIIKKLSHKDHAQELSIDTLLNITDGRRAWSCGEFRLLTSSKIMLKRLNGAAGNNETHKKLSSFFDKDRIVRKNSFSGVSDTKRLGTYAFTAEKSSVEEILLMHMLAKLPVNDIVDIVCKIIDENFNVELFEDWLAYIDSYTELESLPLDWALHSQKGRYEPPKRVGLKNPPLDLTVFQVIKGMKNDAGKDNLQRFLERMQGNFDAKSKQRSKKRTTK